MGALDRARRRMVELLDQLQPHDGARASHVQGVTFLRATHSTDPVPVLYEPCIVIVAQGRKRFHLPDRTLTYDARNYFLLTVPLPASCETTAGDDGPFLGLGIRIELAMLGELLIDVAAPTSARRSGRRDLRVAAPPMTPRLSGVALRLLEALASAEEARVLGKPLVRELVYRVLSGADGDLLRDLLLVNESRTQIHRLLHRMHVDYSSALDVPSLAREAGMSVSALHLHFKEVTDTSPLQYLKRLRLHKARMLMVQESLGASLAAQRVGYDSASQFSREFKRLFGAPPAEEAQRVRAAFGFTDQVSAERG